ncbi:MAG: response regulator [Flavobacteriaceae bacterium]|nr:response regulator [Flavobacteriaceae bacterium]
MKFQQLKTFIFFISIIFLNPSFSIAQTSSIDTTNTYTVKNNYHKQSLFRKTKILKNQESITIEELLSHPEKYTFQTLTDSIIKDHKSAWLKVILNPQIDLKEASILFKRNTEEFREIAALDSVFIYLVQNKHIIKSTQTGVYIPASKKDIPFPVSVNTFKVPLEKGNPTEIYIHAYDIEVIFPLLELREQSNPIKKESSALNTFLIILSSIAFILGFYVLFFYFFTKDKSYLYLSGAFFIRAVHNQLLSSDLYIIQLFFSEHPKWIQILWILTTLPSVLMILIFVQSFVNLQEINRKLYRINRGIIYALILMTITSLVLFSINPTAYYQVEDYFAASSFIAFLVIVVRLAFYRNVLVRYVVLAVGWLFMFNILGILWNLGIIPFFSILNPWVLSQLGFMLILSLAIARKVQLSERAKSEVEKVKEIDSIKSKFFANISHEFRTPLSLILGPINQSIETIPATETLDDSTEVPVKGKHLKVMKRNALRLQNLVDQILDLSKLDQGKMNLQVTDGNLIQFLRSLVFSFESLAEIKHIRFQTHFPKEIANTYFDKDKLEKILVNLLSNALKFTPEHGEVSVHVEDSNNALKIRISDTGRGLSKEEINHIFNRFYQTETTQDQGTGIGLALVKELVELYHGQISVDSMEGHGTTFKVILPYQSTDFRPDEIVTHISNSTAEISNPTLVFSDNETPDETAGEVLDAPLLLIVEDNPDLRDYIAEQMVRHFKILTAKDGKEGIEMATTEIPDLVISDVMMPKMTGIELCEKLKRDVKTSHIPIILLTAKAEQTDKIEGLQMGADAYVTKPFDGKELLIRAKNLIQQREQLRQKYSSELKIGPSEVTLTSMDERFMKQVLKTVEEHMGNEFYTVEDLASEVGFSRSQLNRKLKSILGKSPNHLIRDFRLARAKELLEQKSASISEIAYQVGYSNLSYFSKSYKEAFGKLPSEV